MVATPGLTGIRDPDEARRVLLEEARAADPHLGEGPVVDVGSGGGSPGIPLAVARPELRFVLLEASRRKCSFLETASAELPNVSVLCARAEEHAAGSGRDAYGTAVARALASPPVACEWCLPLVRPGGIALLFVGPSADEGAVARVASELGAELEDSPPGFLRMRKTGPTPERFPRRPGMARKRPLA
ncbi:MAG TPA: RsmG family class I SAM-dependent methyltransferase [Gaiellaceae bacterium]|nr:RsmG family class I SAM-dependent methyltransferase [Gaiellaceae bacterium]